jgi:hypothetical protein
LQITSCFPEHVAVFVLVQHLAPERLDLAGVVATSDAEDDPAIGEDIGGGIVLGEPQGMPHGTDVEAAADLELLRHVREMHTQHQDIRDALVAFVLEVMLSEPQGVVTEPVHRLGERFTLREHCRELLVGVPAFVGWCRLLPHIAKVDMAGIE